MAGVSTLVRYERGPEGMELGSGRLHRASISTILTLKGTGSVFSTSCVLCSCSPGRLRSWQGSLPLPSTRSGTCCLRPSLVYGRSPFELHTGKKPDVSKCLPLGSMVIVHDYDPSRGGVRRNKYMPRGRLGVYVGPCEIGARVYLFDTHCVTRRRLEDLHSEPDRWLQGYDPASGFLIELERHAAMLRDRISRSYLGEEEEQRRRAGLAKAGADEERKASAGELVGDSREEDDGEGTEMPEVPVADKRARGSGGGGLWARRGRRCGQGACR